MNTQNLSRRTFLKGTGVALSLPFLDAMFPQRVLADGSKNTPPRRMVCICTSLGLHAENLFPTTPGRDYALSPYLQTLKDHREEFSVFSGLSHPEQAGRDGHSSEMTWLTSAKNPGLGGFRNTISLDQYVAEKIGYETRFPSLIMGTGGGSQSYTRSGVMISADSSPSRIFAKLFLDGLPGEVQAQMKKIREGRSIMDVVQEQAKGFARRVGQADRDKLDEYYNSVREMEQRLVKSEDWTQKPKPKLEIAPPKDIQDERDFIGRTKLLFDLVPLALQTDSTRLVTILVSGGGKVPLVDGVTIDHHGLSHHGKDPEKLAQLRRVEEAQFEAFGGLLGSLKKQREGEARLIDNTMVLFGSNLGNANAHDWRNLPVVFAGGGFKHGAYHAFNAKDNKPFSNLFVTMLQRMNIETESFGSSSGTISEII